MNPSLTDARSRVLALRTVAEMHAVLTNIYEETAIRHLAAQYLGQSSEAGCIALQEAFTAAKDNPPGRVAALQALVRYFPKESEAMLLEALDDPWPRVQRSARLVLKNATDQFPSKFRLYCFLPPHLRQDRRACGGNFHDFGIHDQVKVIEAIRQARFAPVLPKMIVHLHRHGQRTGNGYLAYILCNAVCVFGNMALAPIVELLRTTDRDRYSLFSALANINTPESWAALETFLPTNAAQQLIQGRNEKRMAGSTFQRSSLTLPQTHERHKPPTLPQYIFEIHSRQLFVDDSEMVHQAIETLKHQANPEVEILFWVLADDPKTARKLRQKAHNALEFWRRYNEGGKR